MNLSQYYGSGSKRSPAIPFASSQAFTIPVSGMYRLSALAASGSGAAIFTTTTGGAATGGGGGQFAESEVYLVAGTVVTIVIGAGGAPTVSSISGTGVVGTDGGNTTITCTGVAITTHGGKGGQFTTVNAAVAPGALGGTGATGAQFTADGGASGPATHTTNATNATGGGAAGSPLGVGGKSGASTGTGTAATGGAAIGGNDSGTASGAGAAFTGGAGTGSASPAQSGAGNGIGGKNRLGLQALQSMDGIARIVVATGSAVGTGFESLIDPFRALTGGGITAQGGTLGTNWAGPGAGGDSGTGSNGIPGPLGASGGASFGGATASANAQFGGGSGAAASKTTGPATSGTGGNGLVTIERIG